MDIAQRQSVKLIPTDPWDFVTAAGSGPFIGKVTHVDLPSRTKIVIRLDDPIRYGDLGVRFILACTRHVGEKFEFRDNVSIFCNMTSLTEEEGHNGTFCPPLLAERLRFLGDVSLV